MTNKNLPHWINFVSKLRLGLSVYNFNLLCLDNFGRRNEGRTVSSMLFLVNNFDIRLVILNLFWTYLASRQLTWTLVSSCKLLLQVNFHDVKQHLLFSEINIYVRSSTVFVSFTETSGELTLYSTYRAGCDCDDVEAVVVRSRCYTSILASDFFVPQ